MPRLKPIRGILIRSSHPLARGLAGCWLLGEGTGQMVADIGPYRQHGSFHGGSPLWKPGQHGSCLEFDGTDKCIDCGSGKFGWDFTNELSIVALANHSASQTNTVFCRSRYSRPIKLYGLVNGGFAFQVRADVSQIMSSTSTHATDGSEWVHVAGTWRPNDGHLYINGVQEAYNTAIGGTLAVLDDMPVGIGGVYEGATYVGCWNGGIEYVFIYNRALSAEEIRWLYRKPFAMFNRSISSAPVHAPASFVSLAGFAGATSAASARLESINSSAEIKSSWMSDALFNGITANAFKLGTTLSFGWFWIRIAGCSALYRGLGMDRIDFANILAISNQDATAISPPGYLPHDRSITYFYVIRRFNHCGNWELTLSAATKVSIDENGDLAKPRPNKVFALKAEQTNGNRIRLTWFYYPLEQESPPACFHVYYDGATGQIDYETALVTIKYTGQKFYSYTSDTLQSGRYLFAVKAEDADSTQYVSSERLAIELDGTGPDGIEILAVETI